jgi:hypothetical protein
VAAQLAASQEWLSSVSMYVLTEFYVKEEINCGLDYDTAELLAFL